MSLGLNFENFTQFEKRKRGILYFKGGNRFFSTFKDPRPYSPYLLIEVRFNEGNAQDVEFITNGGENLSGGCV